MGSDRAHTFQGGSTTYRTSQHTLYPIFRDTLPFKSSSSLFFESSPRIHKNIVLISIPHLVPIIPPKIRFANRAPAPSGPTLVSNVWPIPFPWKATTALVVPGVCSPFCRGSIFSSIVSAFRLVPLFAISVDCPPVSAPPESSTMADRSDPSSGHQPRAPGRTPGNHTPRHVQWASAVDDEEVAGRQRDRNLDSEAASTHELDEAGLDVRTVC